MAPSWFLPGLLWLLTAPSQLVITRAGPLFAHLQAPRSLAKLCILFLSVGTVLSGGFGLGGRNQNSAPLNSRSTSKVSYFMTSTLGGPGICCLTSLCAFAFVWFAAVAFYQIIADCLARPPSREACGAPRPITARSRCWTLVGGRRPQGLCVDVLTWV